LAGLHSLLHENLLFEVLEDTRSSTCPCFSRGRFQTVFFVVFSAHFLIVGSPLAPFGRLKASFFDKLWSPGGSMGSKVGPGSPEVGPGPPKDSLWSAFGGICDDFCHILPISGGRGYAATFCTLRGFLKYFACIHFVPIR